MPETGVRERALCIVTCGREALRREIHGADESNHRFRDISSVEDRASLSSQLPEGVVRTTTQFAGNDVDAIGLRIWADGVGQTPSMEFVQGLVEWLTELILQRRTPHDREILERDLASAIGIVLAAIEGGRLEIRRVPGVWGFVVGMPFPTTYGTRIDLIIGVGQDRYWLSTQGLRELRREFDLRHGIEPGQPAVLRLYPLIDELDRRWERVEALIADAQDDFNDDVDAGVSVSVKDHLVRIGGAMRARAEEFKHVAPMHRAADLLGRANAVIVTEEDDVVERFAAAEARLEVARGQLTDLQQAVIATASYDREQRGESLQTAVTLGTGALLVPGLVAGIFGANVAPLSTPGSVYLGPFLLVIAAASSLALSALVAAGSLTGWGRWRWTPAVVLALGGFIAGIAWAIPGSSFHDHWNGFTAARWAWLASAGFVIVAAAAARLGLRPVRRPRSVAAGPGN